MSQYAFGSGTLYAVATTGAVGVTPMEFGALQGVQLDFSFTTKALYGQYSYPLAVGRGTAKMTGKASFGKINARVFNNFFLGQAALNNSVYAIRTATDEAQVVVTKNITITHNTSYLQDLGVIYTANGQPLQKITNANATLTADQYYVTETGANAGLYQFNASHNGDTMLVSYTYQPGANVGSGTFSIPWTNQLIGVAPEFMLVLHQTFNGQDSTLIFNSCISSKLSWATKMEDFTIPDFDFEIKADASNNIGSLNFDA